MELNPLDVSGYITKIKNQMEIPKLTKLGLLKKGFTQKDIINYEETFFPVAMHKFIRILLSFVAHYDYDNS